MTLTERRQDLDRRLRETVTAEMAMRETLDQIHDQGQQLRGAISVLDQLIAESGNGQMPAEDVASTEEMIGGGPDA